MEGQCDEKRASDTPMPITERHETEAVTSKPVSVTQTSLIKVEQNLVQHEPRSNLSLDESQPISNIEHSRYKPNAEVLSMVPSSSIVVSDILGGKTDDVIRNKIDDVLGSKIDDIDKSAKQTVATAYSSPPKGSNCSFGVTVENESIHSREVTPQPSRSADSISISSCQSLLKDQNFENQLPFCRSLSSSLCQDIPLPLSFSSVCHTSSMDSVLVGSQSLDQTLTPLRNNLGNYPSKYWNLSKLAIPFLFFEFLVLLFFTNIYSHWHCSNNSSYLLSLGKFGTRPEYGVPIKMACCSSLQTITLC